MLDTHKPDETGRQFALNRLEVLDSPKEEAFENVVTLIKQVINVPMCAISLVDESRQWFKAERGLGVCETARDISFCTHAIQDTEPFIITDASADERFRKSPLVIGEPFIKSYAGIPLRSPDGYVVGSLCAMDKVPREFASHEIAMLENFAQIVINELELRQIASTDALTGANSRGAWMERAQSVIEAYKDTEKPVTAVIMDIDHFKSVNDTFGHPAGDKVIQELANTIMANIRKDDIFGRYGGEEFVILLPNTDFAGAHALVERIRELFNQIELDALDGKKCSVSIGFTLKQDDEVEIASLVDRADRALYMAKEGGRNRSIFVENTDRIDELLAVNQ